MGARARGIPTGPHWDDGDDDDDDDDDDDEDDDDDGDQDGDPYWVNLSDFPNTFKDSRVLCIGTECITSCMIHKITTHNILLLVNATTCSRKRNRSIPYDCNGHVHVNGQKNNSCQACFFNSHARSRCQLSSQLCLTMEDLNIRARTLRTAPAMRQANRICVHSLSLIINALSVVICTSYHQARRTGWN